MKDIAQKECPKCGVINPETNIFCPQCGFCFIDDEKKEEKHPSAEKRLLGMEVEKNKKLIRVLVVLIIIIAVFAGVASFLISMEVQESTLVTVETGTSWKCSECGEIFKNRILTVDVKKSESEKYGVETVSGICYKCRYGEKAGEIADWLELLYYNGYFYDSPAEISDKAAQFISANPELFPASGQDQVEAVAVDVDPRLVRKDYDEYNGKLIHVEGRVTTSETVKSEDGSKITYMVLKPEAESQELNINFVVIYQGAADVLQDDSVDCYLLPIDSIKYKDGEIYKHAIITIAAYLTVKKPGI